jgi:trk system potassium uptake protein TrkH
MNFRSILYINGILILALALSMAIPMAVDLYMNHHDWKVFFLCMTLGLFLGGALVLNNRGSRLSLNRREAFLVIVSCWLTASLLGTLPFVFSDIDLTFSLAFFESVSGVTTTGSSVIANIEMAPPGILIWRAMLQWLGGMGTLLMAASILPFLGIGGMQIFRSDQSDQEKALTRSTKMTLTLGSLYAILTLLCATAYSLTGMGRLDAAAHAMSTLSTGGFSTHELSFGHFDNQALEIIAILFMITGSLPFFILLKGLKGDARSIFQDSQIRAFLLILAGSCLIVTGFLHLHHEIALDEAFRSASFQTVSVITGTGFTTANYNLWGSFIVGLFFFLMAIGGCAGSTSGGIKIFRIQIFFLLIAQHIQRLFYPHGVFVKNYNAKPIPADVPVSVLGFLFVYAGGFLALALALSLTGVDVMTALSGAIAALSNTSLGMGDVIGPTGHYKDLPESAHWILSAGMLLGRLEIIVALVILQPFFWTK